MGASGYTAGLAQTSPAWRSQANETDTVCESVCVFTCTRPPAACTRVHQQALQEDSSASLLLSGALWLGNATADHATDSISQTDSKCARMSIAGASAGTSPGASLQHLSLCGEGGHHLQVWSSSLPTLFLYLFLPAYFGHYRSVSASCVAEKTQPAFFLNKILYPYSLCPANSAERSGKLVFHNANSALLLSILLWVEEVQFGLQANSQVREDMEKLHLTLNLQYTKVQLTCIKTYLHRLKKRRLWQYLYCIPK